MGDLPPFLATRQQTAHIGLRRLSPHWDVSSQPNHELFATSDVVSVHLALSSTTHGIVDVGY